MVDVTTSIRINCSLEKVAEYSAKPDNAPKWYKNIKSAQWLTSRPLEKGSQLKFIAKFLGKKLEYVYEINKCEPQKLLIMETKEGPFPMRTTYEWRYIDNTSTQMILRNTGEPKGFSKFLSVFMVPMMKMANNKDLRLLKQILENE